MRYLKPLAIAATALAAAAILAVSAAAMTHSRPYSGAYSRAADSGSGTVVKLGPSNLGQILVDSHGKTLYMWAHDTTATSTCNGACAQVWPPLVTRATPSAGTGAHAQLLGTSRRSDGRLQVTYAGHPLYYFVNDTKPGETNGEGLTGFGGRWDPVSAAGSAVRKPSDSSSTSSAPSYGVSSLRATVSSPRPGARAGVGGTFSVDLSLRARTPRANDLLAGYTAAFNDPHAPSFHPGPNAAAPGLVVLLSTTPTMAGTPLQGPNTNLAGVFQVNDVSKVNGLMRTFNGWIVTVPGFFGKNTQATLTVYAVQGTAPALITGNEQPISNVVRETFTIAG